MTAAEKCPKCGAAWVATINGARGYLCGTEARISDSLVFQSTRCARDESCNTIAELTRDRDAWRVLATDAADGVDEFKEWGSWDNHDPRGDTLMEIIAAIRERQKASEQ